MKSIITIMVLLIVIILTLKFSQNSDANKALSNFVGYHAKALWTEDMSSGETRYYTRWQSPKEVCTAVIGEKHNRYYYLSGPNCSAN